jgi:hypothetical protein
MKTPGKLLFVFSLVFCTLNMAKAQSSLRDDKAKKASEVKKLVDSKDFVFEATRVKGQKVDYHQYDVAISKDTLVANLPGSIAPMKVVSTDYVYNKMENGKGGYNITIKPKAGVTSDVKQIKIEVSPQGHASLRVTANGAGPLSLDGYIKQEDY